VTASIDANGKEAPVRSRAAWTLLLLAGTACTAPADRPAAATVADSAGVELVRHSAALVAALPAWRIDTVVRAQVVGDGESQQFSSIRDAVQRADGGFIIADAAQRDIREFTSAGTLVRVLARRGQGPGEVAFVKRLQMLAGDSLMFIDSNNRRLSLFAPDGRFVRQAEYPRLVDGASVDFLAQLSDGRLLGTVRKPFVPSANDSTYRQPFALVTFSDRGADPVRIDTIRIVPDVLAYSTTVTQGGETYPDESPIRFGPHTAIASNGRRTVVATNEATDLLVYDGVRLMRRIAVDLPVEPFTTADRERFEADLTARVARTGRPPAAMNEFREMLRGWRYAGSLSFADRVLVGDDDSIWVERPLVTPDDPPRYLVFDRSGRAVAQVELPGKVQLLRASLETLLVSWPDDDDVPAVQVRALRRTSEAP